jgi:hypothetical protein
VPGVLHRGREAGTEGDLLEFLFHHWSVKSTKPSAQSRAGPTLQILAPLKWWDERAGQPFGK